MKQKDLLERIQLTSNSLSKSHRRIADYIASHYDKAAFMTAAKLADMVGVSESTVVRFAVELGYEGYPKLQKALQEMISNKLTSVQRMELTTRKMGEKDLLKTVLQSDIDKLRQTLDTVDEDVFAGAVETILQAEKIYILGARSCYSLANFLSFYLNLIFPDVKMISTSSASETFEQIYRVSEKDVVIGISFPRYSKRTISALRYAFDKKSKIIAITDSPGSPVAEHATYTLSARIDMFTFVDSLVAPLSIINALIAALVMRKKADVGKTFEELERIWDAYQVYETHTGKEEQGWN